MDMHERLALARERRGYESAKDAAEAMGVKYPTYAAHENGTRGIRREDVARYAKFFGVGVAWLEFGVGDDGAPETSSKERSLKAHLLEIKNDHVRLAQAIAVVEGAILSAGLKTEHLGELRQLIQECLEEPLDPPVPEAEFASRRDMTKFALAQFLKQRDTLTRSE